MKTIFVENFENQVNKKLLYYLNSYSPGKVLMIFDHGLGDLIEFMNIFVTLKKDFPKWDFYIGHHPSLDYEYLSDKIYKIKEINPNYVIPYQKSVVQITDDVFNRYDKDDLEKTFKIVCAIHFKDYRHPVLSNNSIVINRSKNDICKVLEIGYDENKVLEKYVSPFKLQLNNSNSKRVMFHVGGHTDKSTKNPSESDMELIWNEIIKAGYEPFDVHMNHTSTIVGCNIPLPSYISPDQTIRNSKGNLKLLIDTILTCKYAIGVASGPILLANTILGNDNCIGLESNFKFKDYITYNCPESICIQPYKPNSIYEWLNKQD